MANDNLNLVHLNGRELRVLKHLQGGAKHVNGKPVFTAEGLQLHKPDILQNVIDHHVHHMARGGHFQHEKLKQLSRDGRFGDTKLAYIDKNLQTALDHLIGKSINPKDGRHEYFLGALIGSLGRFIMPAVRAVGNVFRRAPAAAAAVGAGAANAARATATAVGNTASRAGNAIAQPFRNRAAARLAALQRGQSGPVPVPRVGAGSMIGNIAGQVASGGAMGTAMAMPQLIEMGRSHPMPQENFPAMMGEGTLQPHLINEPMPARGGMPEPFQNNFDNTHDYYANLLRNAQPAPEPSPYADAIPPRPGPIHVPNPNRFSEMGSRLGSYLGSNVAPTFGRIAGPILGGYAGYRTVDAIQDSMGVPEAIRGPLNTIGGFGGARLGYSAGPPIANFLAPHMGMRLGRNIGAGVDVANRYAGHIAQPGLAAARLAMRELPSAGVGPRPNLQNFARRPGPRRVPQFNAMPENTYMGGAYPGERDPLIVNGFDQNRVMLDELD